MQVSNYSPVTKCSTILRTLIMTMMLVVGRRLKAC